MHLADWWEKEGEELAGGAMAMIEAATQDSLVAFHDKLSEEEGCWWNLVDSRVFEHLCWKTGDSLVRAEESVETAHSAISLCSAERRNPMKPSQWSETIQLQFA